MVEIYDDRVDIVNPGGVCKGITPENFVLSKRLLQAINKRLQAIGRRLEQAIESRRLPLSLKNTDRLPPPKLLSHSA